MSTAQTASFYVIRVNGYARATYAATTLREALDITFPTDAARLEVGIVQAPDTGAARLMEPSLGWAGPFTVAELEERMRLNEQAIIGRPVDAGGEEIEPDADTADSDEPTPAFYTVAPYLVWRQCGGPEEGGWYYDAGEPVTESWLPLPVICTDKQAAYTARDAMQLALDAEANVGLRDKYSVLSSGVYEAHVSHGYPAPFPAERPFYE